MISEMLYIDVKHDFKKKEEKKEQAVGSLLKFLKNTEIGYRKGAAQRELEWEQRRDKERENQLDDSVIVEG